MPLDGALHLASATLSTVTGARNALGAFDKAIALARPLLALDENEIDMSFIRSSGPGGQNVNKVSSAVQLRFDARRSPSLPNAVAIRLLTLAGSKATSEGVIVITANRHRTQEMNRKDAIDRAVEMLKLNPTQVSADGTSAIRARGGCIDAGTTAGANQASRPDRLRYSGSASATSRSRAMPWSCTLPGSWKGFAGSRATSVPRL